MAGFAAFVEFLVAIGVVITAISSYLIINKLWKRRRKKDVAESVSISAAFLGLATSIPLLIHFALLQPEPLVAIKTAISILTGLVFVAVGAGVWVAGNRGIGFFTLIRRALKLEGRESGDLIKAMIRPKGAEQILRILEQMAAIDREIDAREIALIEEFAEQWKIRAPELTAGRVSDDGNILAVRESVLAYLAIDPPFEQAAHLLDVLGLFIRADERIADEEDLVMEELSQLITRYVEQDTEERSMYEVLIVPQSDSQIEAVRTLIPGTEMKERRGGRVFSGGRFFSERYASVVCSRYIDLGIFTTHVAQ